MFPRGVADDGIFQAIERGQVDVVVICMFERLI